MALPRRTETRDLSGQVDGATQSFTTDPYLPGTLVVELNGQRLRAGAAEDFEETGLQTFDTALPPAVGDTLQVQFEVEDSGAFFPLVVASGSDPTA